MIKRINSSSAETKRPLRVKDLQDIWDGLNSALGNIAETGSPRIISGFNLKAGGTYSKGVIAYLGALYFHPDTVGYEITVGDQVYTRQLTNADLRTFDDTTIKDFAFNIVATTNSASGISLGVFSKENVAKMRIHQGYRVVTGLITMLIEAGTVYNETFTPNNPIDADISFAITHPTVSSFKYSRITFTDENGAQPIKGSQILLSVDSLTQPANYLYNTVAMAVNVAGGPTFQILWPDISTISFDHGNVSFAVTLYFPTFLDV